jgi:WD40 repeat protein
MRVSQIHGFAAAALGVLLARTPAEAQIRPEVLPTQVVIETAPNASVFFDGKPSGTAGPGGRLVIENPAVGEHTIRVTLQQKRPFERKVTIPPGKSTLIRAELVDRTGELEILTTPGAAILLDGKPAGIADTAGRLFLRDLKPRSYKVSANLTGFNLEQREIMVFPDLVNSLAIELKAFAKVSESQSSSTPDYSLQRRLVVSEHSGLGLIKAAFRNDSRQFISWQNGGEVLAILWDPSTGRRVRTVDQPKTGDYVRSVSPDLHWLAIDHWQGGDSRLLDVETGQAVRQLSRNFSRAVFSPDQKHLLGIGSKTLLLNLETGKDDWSLDSMQHIADSAVAYCPDGNLVAIAGFGVSLFDANTGVEVKTLSVKGHFDEVVFSPNGQWLAAAKGIGGGRPELQQEIELWVVATGQPGPVLKLPSAPGNFAFTQDSRYLAVAHPEGVDLWDVATGRSVREWRLPLEKGQHVSFSPDGNWMAASSRFILTVWRRTK